MPKIFSAYERFPLCEAGRSPKSKAFLTDIMNTDRKHTQQFRTPSYKYSFRLNEEQNIRFNELLCKAGLEHNRSRFIVKRIFAEVIDKDGFLHSGDLGVKDENGNYRITGRIKDMIIRGGENIYPRELEEFLYHLKGVKDVQVAAVPSKKYGEEVGAFIILHEGVTMTEDIVKDFCRGKIARHKIPKYIFFVDTYPMTGSGKIQKFKLKDLGLKLLADQGITPV